MNKYLSTIIILISLLACNLGTAQPLNENSLITQYPPVPIEARPPETSDDLLLEATVSSHIRDIYALGQALGNRNGVFSKVGDSITVSNSFLYPFGVGRYNLADYAYLEATIQQFSQANANIGNSFINPSIASREGWSANAVLNPQMANSTYCLAGETPLLCEYRVVRPSIAFIMFGTNDSGYRTVDQYTADMQQIIRLSEENGVIPVLSTIPNRPDVPQQVLRFNDIVRTLAIENQLPYIDLYSLTINLPNYGLTSDNVHLSSSPLGITGTATFDAQNLNYGYVVRNLATLQALHIVQQVIEG